MGWIGGPLPRLVAVQAAGCAPIVRAHDAGAEDSEPFPDAHTVAFGITVPKALGDFLVLRAVRETDGCAVAVSDDQLLAEQRKLAAAEGTFICPEGAACLAAARESSHRRRYAQTRVSPGTAARFEPASRALQGAR